MTISKQLRTLALASIFSLAIFSSSAQAVSTPQIRITEIMYDPPGSAVREFIEIYNGSDSDADLTDWSMSGVTFNFSSGTILTPGQYAVIANDEDILQADHPSLEILGEYSGDLEGTGETIKVLDQLGETVSEVTYGSSNPWPSSPYDEGPTLSLIRSSADESMVECWAESSDDGGTPGALNSVADLNQIGCLDKAYLQTVVVNPPDPQPESESVTPQTSAISPTIRRNPTPKPQQTPAEVEIVEPTPQVQAALTQQDATDMPLETPAVIAVSEQAKVTLKTKLIIATALIIPTSAILLIQLVPHLTSRGRHKKLLKFKKGFKEL
jgi:hypothetical protein